MDETSSIKPFFFTMGRQNLQCLRVCLWQITLVFRWPKQPLIFNGFGCLWYIHISRQIYTWSDMGSPYKWRRINGVSLFFFYVFLSGDMGGPLLTTVVFGAHFVNLR